jgi:hypothetical protein
MTSNISGDFISNIVQESDNKLQKRTISPPSLKKLIGRKSPKLPLLPTSLHDQAKYVETIPLLTGKMSQSKMTPKYPYRRRMI